MEQNRRDLLAQLELSLKNISEVITVMRCYSDLDLTQFTASQLPLIEQFEPDERVEQQMVGRRQIIRVNLVLRVHFVSWAEIPASTYETLVKKIRNKLAESFTLNQKATGLWVNSVGDIRGELPLYNFEIGLICKYYLAEEDA